MKSYKYWSLASIPAAFIAAAGCAFINLCEVKSIAGGAIGGAIGVIVAFQIIGLVDWFTSSLRR